MKNIETLDALEIELDLLLENLFKTLENIDTFSSIILQFI